MIDITERPYRCRGDGSTQEGAKLANALATGDDLYLPRGLTFLMDGVTLTPQAGQRISGGGRLRKTVEQGGYVSTFIRVLGVDGVTVEDIEFECAGNSREYGVTVQDAKHATIQRCKFVSRATPVFIWRGSQYTRVLDNWMTGGQQGIATGGDATNGTANGLVLDTWIERNTITGMDTEGIDLNWDTQRCWLRDNRIYGNALVDPATEVDIGGGNCSQIYLSGNEIDGLGHTVRGVMTKHFTHHSQFIGNTVRGCERGLEFWNVDRVIARHNTLSECATMVQGAETATNSSIGDNL